MLKVPVLLLEAVLLCLITLSWMTLTHYSSPKNNNESITSLLLAMTINFQVNHTSTVWIVQSKYWEPLKLKWLRPNHNKQETRINKKLTSSSCTWWSEVFACSETCWSWSYRQNENGKLDLQFIVHVLCDYKQNWLYLQFYTWVSSSSFPLFFSSVSEAFNLKIELTSNQ